MTVHVSVRSISALLLLSVSLLGLPPDDEGRMPWDDPVEKHTRTTFTLQPFTESGRGQ